MDQKNGRFITISILKMLDLNLNHMFLTNVMIFFNDAYEFENIAILNVKGVDFRCVLWGISRNEAVDRLNNSVLENKGVL